MKAITVTLTLAICFALSLQSQPYPDLLNSGLITLSGEKVEISDFFENQGPMVLIFWKSYESKCCENLSDLNDVYEDELMDMGVKMVGICVDCIGQFDHIRPYVDANNISIDVCIDVNGDFKRAMSIPAVPYTVLFDGDNNVICQYNGYCANSGEMLCEKIRHCLAVAD